ncbi:hypothetical protein ACP3WI_25175, partial [Salmonella enterica]
MHVCFWQPRTDWRVSTGTAGWAMAGSTSQQRRTDRSLAECQMTGIADDQTSVEPPFSPGS